MDANEARAVTRIANDTELTLWGEIQHSIRSAAEAGAYRVTVVIPYPKGTEVMEFAQAHETLEKLGFYVESPMEASTGNIHLTIGWPEDESPGCLQA